MFQLQIARLIRKGRGVSSGRSGTTKKAIFEFLLMTTVVTLMKSLLSGLMYRFCTLCFLRTGISEHDQILLEKGGITFEERIQ